MIDQQTKSYRASIIEMQTTMNRMEETIEMSYNCIANYRQLWGYLLQQSWYRNHLNEIQQYMERMETSSLKKHSYGFPEVKQVPKQWFIDRINKTIIRFNPIEIEYSEHKVTEDSVNRFWIESEKGYIFEDKKIST